MTPQFNNVYIAPDSPSLFWRVKRRRLLSQVSPPLRIISRPRRDSLHPSLSFAFTLELHRNVAATSFPTHNIQFLSEKKSHYPGSYTLSHSSIQFSLAHTHSHTYIHDTHTCETRGAAVSYAWSTDTRVRASLDGRRLATAGRWG